MTSKADTIELAESEVARLVEVALRQGVPAQELLGIFLRHCCDLYLRAGVESRMKGGSSCVCQS